MKKKSVLAFMMAFAMVAGMAAAPAITTQAAGLTQAQDASAVQYGSLTAEETKLLESMFDYEYYKAQNSDLVTVLGDDPAKLFEHFCKCGIFEGRTCNANFDPAAYASAYTDLRASFGTNIFKYYEHFSKFAVAENRTISTVAACAKAGITVQGLVGDDVKISPAAYMLAEKLGTTDYTAVQQALTQAVNAENEAKASNGGNGGSGIVTTKEIDPTYAKAHGMEKVDQISIGDAKGGRITLYIYAVKGEEGYAAYETALKGGYTSRGSFDEEYTKSFELIYATDDYKPADEINVIGEGRVWLDTIAYDGPNQYISDTTVDMTGEVYDERTPKYPSDGVKFQTFYYHDQEYNNTVIKNVEATLEEEYTYEVAGIYTNADGTEKKPFTAEEKAAYYSENDINPEYMKGSMIYDPKAKADTAYDVGVTIKENENGTINMTIGLSSEETEYGYILEVETVDQEPGNLTIVKDNSK